MIENLYPAWLIGRFRENLKYSPQQIADLIKANTLFINSLAKNLLSYTSRTDEPDLLRNVLSRLQNSNAIEAVDHYDNLPIDNISLFHR